MDPLLPAPLVTAGSRCAALSKEEGSGLASDGPFAALVAEVAALSVPALPTATLHALLPFGTIPVRQAAGRDSS